MTTRLPTNASKPTHASRRETLSMPTLGPSEPGDPTTLPAPVSGDVGIHPRLAGRLAGIGYVLIFGLAIFANFVVREQMVVAGDAEATVANIVDSEGLFRLGLVSFLLIFALDVVISWALHVVFRSHHHDLSLLAAWSRLVYTVFLGVAAVFFFQALQLVSGAGFLQPLEKASIDAQALVAVDTFNAAWLIGLLVFGLHLGLLGFLIVRWNAAPAALGWLLMVAGTAYVVDTVANALLADYQDHAGLFLAAVAVPSIVGEGWFGLWLLLRAGRDRV